MKKPTQEDTLRPRYTNRWRAGRCAALGIKPESARYLSQVAQWRNAFRPSRVRTLLVAESHVAENSNDTSVRVAIPPSLNANTQLPNGFCRLVYCLGYGEPELCRPKPVPNPGTWQFWDLFGAIASGFDRNLDARLPRRRELALEQRIAWKLHVLTVLREQGVWLVDASVLGLYSYGRRLTRGKHYQQFLKESFEFFVWPDVADDGPEVWVIGRCAARALLTLPMINPTHVISQPQDRDGPRYKRDVQRMVRIIANRTVA